MKVFLKITIGLFITLGLTLSWLFYDHTITNFDRPWFLSDKEETIVVAYVNFGCNTAKFVEINSFKTNPITEPNDDDYFFIEPSRTDIDWDRNYFNKNASARIRLTGQFYLDKGISTEFKLGSIEDKPSHAKVFLYDKLEYLSK